MTVAQLIELLRELPQDAKVVVVGEGQSVDLLPRHVEFYRSLSEVQIEPW